jgi:hypothetical protein
MKILNKKQTEHFITEITILTTQIQKYLNQNINIHLKNSNIIIKNNNT